MVHPGGSKGVGTICAEEEDVSVIEREGSRASDVLKTRRVVYWFQPFVQPLPLSQNV